MTKQKNIWQQQINFLVEWAEQKEIKVNFVDLGNDLAKPWEKIIQIRKRQDKEIVFYLILHELGHIIMENKNEKTYKEKFKHLLASKQEKRYASLVYRIGVLEEEIEAWNVGEKLCTELNLKLNEKRWWRLRARKLTTYASWVCARRLNLSNGTNTTTYND